VTDQEAIDFTNKVFDSIRNARSISDLEKIPKKCEILSKKTMDVINYPRIEFDITNFDIESLVEKQIFSDSFNFASDITQKLTDPLSKLLYAMAWKNGDLKKLKHIVKGILDDRTEIEDQDEALVFYQFGKFLTKKSGQPIIDQHVIRAFAVYSNSSDINSVTKFRRLETIDKSHKSIINKYINWLSSDALMQELQSEKDYSYYIDKLLFAAGKTIKSRS
jgi:hypothetical protein